MTELALATKHCRGCDRELPLSQFYKHESSPGGIYYRCRECATAKSKASQARRRAAMGEEAWLATQARIVARSRRNPEVRKRERKSTEAYRAALYKLRDLHDDEFRKLLAVERYERGLP